MRNATTQNITALCYTVFAAEILLVVAQMWGHVCTPELFAKISITNGAVLAALITLNFMIKEDRVTNKLSLACFALFVAGLVLGEWQMWFSMFDALLFMKLCITDAALFLILFVANFLDKENRQTDVINDGSKLDD